METVTVGPSVALAVEVKLNPPMNVSDRIFFLCVQKIVCFWTL
ncbi:hypothetical protein [Bacillus tropicus]|nr:hypothetical protein [Bacillus tropicus]